MRSIFAIAINSYRESVRSKVLYSMFVFALVLILAAAFFGTVSIGKQITVIQNFGLFSISIFTVAFTCIAGSNFLYKELQRRTVFTVLSRPVARWQFLAGKYIGMLATVTIMILIMGAGLSLFSFFLEGTFSVLLLRAYLNIWFELVIICAAAIFFSSIVVTPLLSGLFTFGIFLAGRSAEYVLYFVKQGSLNKSLSGIMETLYWIMPHLDFFDNNNSIVYGIAPSAEHLYWSFAYVLGYAGSLLCLASIIFMRREFNK